MTAGVGQAPRLVSVEAFDANGVSLIRWDAEGFSGFCPIVVVTTDDEILWQSELQEAGESSEPPVRMLPIPADKVTVTWTDGTVEEIVSESGPREGNDGIGVSLEGY